MTNKWNLIVDVARCDNCRNCFLATKDEHIGNDFPGYAASQPERTHSWVDIKTKERGSWPIVEAHFMPVMCNHCDDAPCMKVAKDGAITKRADGIVIIDPVKSKGQKAIVDACPYGAVYWNEEKQIPQAWIFDAHLLDQGWTKPRVEQSCPTSVFRTLKVTDDEMRQIAKQESLDVLLPEQNSKPRVYYKNLHLMTSCFVSGSVVVHVKGVEECAANADVVLKRNGAEAGRTTTDVFGEFKIDKLEPRSGRYELQVGLEPAHSLSLTLDLVDDSLNLGVMTLNAKA
ncbi:MAG: oxidoreductase [Alphaproteobacteria bacterium]|nr:oxidoreductase [Alphaproteobacteria bacterium]PHX99649.1 MAG: oxidoreductase [Rhodospirillaceae bacterium]